MHTILNSGYLGNYFIINFTTTKIKISTEMFYTVFLSNVDKAFNKLC